MPVVDYERAWLALKAHVASKPAHGKRELFQEMVEIEVASMIPDGQEGFDPRPVARLQAAGDSR